MGKAIEENQKEGRFAILGVMLAEQSIPWPKRGEAEKELCEREGWSLQEIPSMRLGQPVMIEAMCRGQLAVNHMMDDEGFAISLSESGWRISYGGRVFARCGDAMQAAEAMMAEPIDWNIIESRGFNDDHRRILKAILEDAEKRGEIMLDRVFPNYDS